MRADLDRTRAVVTGASSGIGREIARELAPRASAIALVARRRERLDELADELRRAHSGLVVHVVPCDLGDRDAAVRLGDTLIATMGGVDLLVNNAGLGIMGVFDRSDVRSALGMIDVNVSSLVALTHSLLPPMVERGRGAILNISSGFGMTWAPGFAVYIGTKHFVTGFSEALRLDLEGTGVVVTQVCPGPVETEFEEVSGNFTGRGVPGFVVISARQCARESLSGVERGDAIVFPGLANRLGMGLIAWTPRFVQRLALAPAGRWLRARQAQLSPGSTP
jgi:short-subunit dehydrogenase